MGENIRGTVYFKNTEEESVAVEDPREASDLFRGLFCGGTRTRRVRHHPQDERCKGAGRLGGRRIEPGGRRAMRVQRLHLIDDGLERRGGRCPHGEESHSQRKDVSSQAVHRACTCAVLSLSTHDTRTTY